MREFLQRTLVWLIVILFIGLAFWAFSGPIEGLIAAGVAQGLDERTARALTLQTALGAAQMAITSDAPPAELRRRVTSKGGTTEQAIAVFEESQMQQTFMKALTACAHRGQELATVLDEQG